MNHCVGVNERKVCSLLQDSLFSRPTHICVPKGRRGELPPLRPSSRIPAEVPPDHVDSEEVSTGPALVREGSAPGAPSVQRRGGKRGGAVGSSVCGIYTEMLRRIA